MYLWFRDRKKCCKKNKAPCLNSRRLLFGWISPEAFANRISPEAFANRIQQKTWTLSQESVNCISLKVLTSRDGILASDVLNTMDGDKCKVLLSLLPSISVNYMSRLWNKPIWMKCNKMTSATSFFRSWCSCTTKCVLNETKMSPSSFRLCLLSIGL